MIAKHGKRALSLFLAVIMILSAVPFQAFAAEPHDHSEENSVTNSESASTSADAGESEELIALRAEIAEYVDELEITPDMPDQYLLYAYGNHNSLEAAQASVAKADEFEQAAMMLSKEEQKILASEDNTKLALRYIEVAEKAYETMAASEYTVNNIKFSNSGGSLSESGGTLTATVKGEDGSCGGSGKTASMTLYITNTTEGEGTVSFNMTQTSVNSIVVGTASGAATSESLAGKGSYSYTLAAGASFSIIITTGANATQNKLELSNIKFTSANEAFTVTVEYPTSNGTVTSSATGTAVDADGTTTITIPEIKAVDGVTLTAESSTFLCWVDQNNTILSTEKTYTVKPSADTTVKAIMTGGNACFKVNGNQAFVDLNEAVQAASSSKTIVLMNNGTLPAGDYTIPSGVTLLIPYNDANTLCTTAPTTTDAAFSTPTVYRKLTMAEGANIIIDGAMSLSGTQTASNGRSNPTGACSFVQMNSGSSITVNKGGNLYAWGYIQGSGSVTVKSGATAYECFQVMDWRGGDNTSGMVGNSQRVFPFSQYYVQNVEVPMTLEAGATEKGYMSISISVIGIQSSAIPFIGSDGMFNINSGHIVKDYDETTGRLTIDVHGALSIKSLSMSMKLGILGSSTINSKDYVLPINGNMTVTMHDGGSINMTQDIALQPGARLIVEEGATCTLGSGNKIFVYDYDEWTTEVAADAVQEGPSFCGTGDATYVNLPYPATIANNVTTRAQDAYVEINGTADLSAGYVYTTKGGANVRGTGTIIMQPGKADEKTYQVKNTGSDNKTDKWVEIPITSAVLTNADGSTVVTANDLGKVTYTSVDGVWTCAHTYAEGTYKETVQAATCLADGLKTFSCNCGEVSKTEVIPQLDHEYESVVTAPTCTEDGYTTHTCKNGCKDTYKDTIVEALGHDEVNHEAQAPTCTEAGWEAYVTCSRCDYNTKVEIAALGHTAGAEATCETAQVCTVCGSELNAALGHNYNNVVTAPTCTEAGYTTHTCATCGDTYTDSETAATGHQWEWINDKDATVLEPGVKHEECSVCHEKQNENTEIPMLKCSHEGTITTTEAKAETCTEAGNTRYSYCSACRNYYSDDAGQHEIEKNSWIIPALGHDEVAHEAQAVTCTEIGWDAYVACSRCDYTTYEEIAALGHDEVEHEGQAATCKAAGWEPYVTCSRCDYNTKVELPADPDAHVWDEGVEYGNHSCNSPLRMKYECTVKGCGQTKFEIIIEQHFRVPIGKEIPATCTTDGMTSGWKCEKCDEFWIPQEVIPALGHDWNGVYPCQNDSAACTRCDTYFDVKQDHLEIVDPGFEASCSKTGLTDGSHCGFCGVTLTEQTEIPVTDHNWYVDDMEIPATCTTPGHKAGATYCLNCDYDEDPIPALDHSWMHRDAKKATYSAIGWNAHDYCLLCKATKTLEEYEEDSCEFCGENPEGYIEIPMVAVQSNKTYEELVTNLYYLEMMAGEYAKENPGTDPLGLVLNYMRTGVSNYTSGSWAIMAGPENKDFLKYVQEAEDAINSNPDIDVWVNVSGLKKLNSVFNDHGEYNVYQPSSKVRVLSGHFFGTMDMTYYNKGSQNHADVGGWVGDLTDLLSTSDEYGVPANLTLDEKVEYIRKNYLFKTDVSGSAGSFGNADLYADLEGYYFANELITNGYEPGDLTALMREFYQPGLTLADRVSYLLDNRLDGLSTRKDLRTAVYNAYTSNKLIATLEGTRNFNATGNELAELRKAVCYAFADEMCRIAGDYVEDLTNPRFTVFDTDTKILAPGVSQQINYATNADGNQIVYYVATADVGRDDVGLWVNYYDRDPGTPENPQWRNNSVPSSAQNAQDRYGDPASEDYIENFNVIASTNAGGYDMSDVATPGGLMVMNGIEWHPQSGTAGFFAILDDGTAYMGTHAEYATMKDRIKEAIGGFGEFVVQNGQVTGSAAKSDAPRTSVGITATGRVVLMCIDGRQAPFSSGASLEDVGYIMKEAGCVVAINLDGGGSTTFVARQPGDEELSVMNRPSDGYPRNVSTNLLIYSTAPSSTKFDHAVVESEYDYATVNTPVQMTAVGVSPAGNAVDIPEGATWAVSNEDWASITEDGVFTGKRMGEVTVYLMLDGQVVGSKLMTMTTPDQLYFEKAKIDVIYGSSVELPLRARTAGKAIAINPDDVTITMSAANAGTMDGFTFTAVESAVKSMTITAAISESISASINVMLYKQGENSFDFDKATGGDRQLAWDRQVTNAKVEDGNIYNVIDPSEDMVTSYVFALDMTALPIPERLEELTYMLPGGTIEGTNAWTFLTSLAQRISDLTWVKATIDIDDRFDVDYSDLKVLNDYFELQSVELDEATNTLTVTLGWIKQSQVIDIATANPLCMINGVKLTPKDGVWEDATKINVVTTGNISYQMYMRASGLYSFAQKPENQAVFGIYPYRNPADTNDAGGYFYDTYAEITDAYTLVNVLKEGWVNEDGGFAYYVAGERLTGVQKVDGYYYDFGENGINVGQTKLTGLFLDTEANVYRYSYMGELTNGWQSIGDDWYYFKDNEAVSGLNKVGGVKFTFEENGRLTSGVWVNVFNGWRYYYGPTYVQKHWYEVNGEWYYFRDGLAVTGYQYVGSKAEVHADKRWRFFDENGVYQYDLTGVYVLDGKYYYLENGKPTEKGLFVWEGDYYYAKWDGTLIVNEKYYAYIVDASSELPKGNYEFGPDGKMLGGNAETVNGIVEKNGVLYYYENGKPTEKGLFVWEGDYYYAKYDGSLVVNEKYYAYKIDASSELPKGNYEFGPDGKMLGGNTENENGIVEKNGVLYYYENGKPTEKGLFALDGNYYYAKYDGSLVVNEKYYAYKIDASSELSKGNYEFGADGKMLQGIVDKAGVLYFYENGNPSEKGLFKYEGNYYNAEANGKLIVDQKYYVYKLDATAELPKGHYEFDETGRMRHGIENKNGVLYYYEYGNPYEKGLFMHNGEYYYAKYDGTLVVNEKYFAYKIDESSNLPKDHYEFGDDGRMLQGIIDVAGVLYFYENGNRVEKGLFKYEGDYYYAKYDGSLIVNERYYAYVLDATSELPKGSYEFGMDGRMVEGIVDIAGVLYFYENGNRVEKGLFKYEGDYYYTKYDGSLVVNQKYYAYKIDASSELPKSNYEFDADGKVIGAALTGEIVSKESGLYYYEAGQPVAKGLVYLDGYYYFAHSNGKLITNQKYYVYIGNDLLLETHYTFNELGQIIG